MCLSGPQEPTQYPSSWHGGENWIQPLPGAHLYKARMHWFTFEASTAFGFLNLHGIRGVSLWSHWKPLSPLTRSKDTLKLSVCPLLLATLAEGGIFIVAIKKIARHLQALQFMPVPCWLSLGCLHLALEQGRPGTAEGSGKLDHQPGLTAGAAGPLFPPSVPSGLQSPGPRSVRWRTCSSHNQQETDPYARKQRNEGTVACATQNILGYTGVGKRRRKHIKTVTLQCREDTETVWLNTKQLLSWIHSGAPAFTQPLDGISQTLWMLSRRQHSWPDLLLCCRSQTRPQPGV